MRRPRVLASLEGIVPLGRHFVITLRCWSSEPSASSMRPGASSTIAGSATGARATPPRASSSLSTMAIQAGCGGDRHRPELDRHRARLGWPTGLLRSTRRRLNPIEGSSTPLAECGRVLRHVAPNRRAVERAGAVGISALLRDPALRNEPSVTATIWPQGWRPFGSPREHAHPQRVGLMGTE